MGITNKHKVPSGEIESLVGAESRHVNINITVTKNFHKSEKVIHLLPVSVGQHRKQLLSLDITGLDVFMFTVQAWMEILRSNNTSANNEPSGM